MEKIDGRTKAARITREQTAIPRTESQREAKQEVTVKRKNREHLGGVRLNMQVFGEISGYKMHIQPDIDGGLEYQLHRGFTYVEHGEVETNARKIGESNGEDNRISWFAGTDEGGRPYRAYLMKIEESLWQEIQDYYEEQNSAYEDQIIAGQVGNVDSRYQPGSRTGGLTTIKR